MNTRVASACTTDQEQDKSRAANSDKKRSKRPPAVLTRYARVDRAIGGSAIFRQIDRRDRAQDAGNFGAEVSTSRRLSGTRVSVVHDGRQLAITSAHALGANDLGVFLAVLACAGLVNSTKGKEAQQRKAASRAPERHIQGDLIEDLAHDIAATRLLAQGDEWASGKYITLDTTIYTLLHEAGLSPSGNAYKRAGECLERLHSVSCVDYGHFASNNRRMRSSEALLYFAADETTGAVHIIINARLTAAIIAPGYVYVNLDEARRLREAARILHLRLSAKLREGAPRTFFSTDELAEMVYGPNSGVAAQKVQRHRARKTATDLAQLPSWQIEMTPEGVWITRLTENDPRSHLPVGSQLPPVKVSVRSTRAKRPAMVSERSTMASNSVQRF